MVLCGAGPKVAKAGGEGLVPLLVLSQIDLLVEFIAAIAVLENELAARIELRNGAQCGSAGHPTRDGSNPARPGRDPMPKNIR